jgi:uncharacterized phage protein gp47/JayE
MSTFDDTGLHMDTLDEIIASMQADFVGQFGANHKVSADSVTGQIIYIISGVVDEINRVVEAVRDAYDVTAAKGVSLSNLVQINGITRNESEFSTIAVNITANTAGATVTVNSIVSDPNNPSVKFALDGTTVLPPSGSQLVSATAVEAGPVEAASGTISKIDTPIIGWASVSNPGPAIPGANEETNVQLRYRRDITASAIGKAGVPGIYGALSDINSVTEVKVHQNRGSTTDAQGVPGHYLWAIVEGGSDNDVAAVLHAQIAGIGLWGSIPYVYSDPITSASYTVNFDRPTYRDVWVEISLSKFAGYLTGGDALIKQAIVDYFAGDFTLDGESVEGVRLGDSVYRSRLHTPINSVKHHKINYVRLGFSSVVSDQDLIAAVNEKLLIDTSRITVI